MRDPRRVIAAIGRRLPHGWRDAFVQLALWALADALYEGVRGLVVGKAQVAFANADWVVSLERQVGVFWEPQLQALVTPDHTLSAVFDWTYLNVQFTMNLLFLALVYCYRNEIFYFVRNMFFIAMGIALTVHLAYPVAPPRMLPRLGFVDTVHDIAHINQDSGAVSLFVNPYAAVPSMHMCFALLVGVTAVKLLRRPWLRLLAALYPLLVLATIVLTANHFLFDAATGALTAVVAAVAAQQVMARLRPQAWAWGRPGAATSLAAEL